MKDERKKTQVRLHVVNLAAFVIGISLLSLGQFSCRNAEKQERLQQLDSLNQNLVQLDELIANLEENDFQQRRDSIRLKLKTLNEAGKDSSTPELKNAVTTYAAIAALYEHFFNDEPVAAYEASE